MKKIEDLIKQEFKKAYLGLGSNMDDPFLHLMQAQQLITNKIGNIDQFSSIYQSKAWGKTDQADFLNMVVEINTTHTPLKLLEAILNIEEEMGRERNEKWGPRIIDIDILFYEDLIINYKHLKIPHPHILHRIFVLLPLSDIKINLIHPEFNQTVKTLIDSCQDNTKIWQIES